MPVASGQQCIPHRDCPAVKGPRMPVASGQQCIPHVIALLLHFVQGTDGPLMPVGEVCQDHSCQMAKCVNRTPLMGCY